jgi:hypothetical protein
LTGKFYLKELSPDSNWGFIVGAAFSSGTLNPPRGQTEDLELIYDPILNCYFDPTNNKYYELKVPPLNPKL